MRPTARLLVPYRDEVDEDGSTFRTPDIPAGWAFEQESSLWDVKPGGKPVPTYRSIPRRALIRVAAPLAEVDALVALYRRQGREGHITREDYDPALAAVREAMRSGDLGASREFRAGMRSQVRPKERALLVSDVIEEAKETAAWLLPLIGSIGLAGAAAYLGLPEASLGAFVLTLTDTETFSGTNGDTLPGRTFDSGSQEWDVGGYTVQTIESNALYYVTNGAYPNFFTTSDYDAYVKCDVINGSGSFGPYACLSTNAGNLTQLYFASLRDSTRVWLRRGSTLLAESSGSYGTTTYQIGIARVGNDLEAYYDGATEATATDSTYSTSKHGARTLNGQSIDTLYYGTAAPPPSYTSWGMFRRLAFLSHLRR